MNDGLIRRVNAMVGLRVRSAREAADEETKVIWGRPDSGLRPTVPDAGRLIERLVMVIVVQLIIMAALLTALFGFMDVYRWR